MCPFRAKHSAGLIIVVNVAISTGPAILRVNFLFIICKGRN